tara:strand:+ start:1949 stop:2287 length:339 start_codon:yes stop_codon:yes gene_type:complete
MSQIFKNIYPKEHFFLFLKKYCDAKNSQYIFSKDSFKRIKLDKAEIDFSKELKKYYFNSKHYYLERLITHSSYKNFVTVIRQICKYHHIPFTSNIKYSKSKYEIKYFIYYEL